MSLAGTTKVELSARAYANLTVAFAGRTAEKAAGVQSKADVAPSDGRNRSRLDNFMLAVVAVSHMRCCKMRQ